MDTIKVEDVTVIFEKLSTMGVELVKNIVAAVIIFFVGRWLIRMLTKMVNGLMERRHVDLAVKSFVGSLVNILLMILLLIMVISTLGIQTTSFAALLASAGVAIGMAMSGSLQNFAGGIIILVLRPYKVGDFIETQGYTGTVKEIQIVNTILTTTDNKVVFIPNASIANGVLTNFSHQDIRRVDFSFGVEYGTDFKQVKDVLNRLIEEDERIMKDPAPFVGLGELADSSVNITVRLWTKRDNYWDVDFEFRQSVYETFNKEGIGFPFPQLTVHQAEN